MLTVGSLFAGIGGFDLGLERTGGFRTAWFCESDPFCQRVLAKHWPDVPCFPDVRTLSPPSVDVLCGGFPCPVLSSAARGRNVAEWMWPLMARAIRLVRPRYVIVENVDELLRRPGRFAEVLGDMARCGFNAEWAVLRASDFGAPHHRARLWVVGYADAHGQSDGQSMMKHSGCRNFVMLFGRGPIRPRTWEWMMGFPEDWTAVESTPSATRSSRKSQSGSDDES